MTGRMRTLTAAAVGWTAAWAWAGEAGTSATAGTGGPAGGTAAATANYTGGGPGVARTRTSTGDVNIARGVAWGVDQNGLDFSFSHAIAPRFGPAYAGTFNLSIGRDGAVAGSYGGSLAEGGLARTVQAGGMTRSAPSGGTSAVANAGGNTVGGGRVDARTNSWNRPAFTMARGRFIR